MKRLLLIAFLSPALSQYMPMGMRADVTFGEDNDRFDVTSLVDQQNRLYDKAELRDFEETRRFDDPGKKSRDSDNKLAATIREAIRKAKAELKLRDIEEHRRFDDGSGKDSIGKKNINKLAAAIREAIKKAKPELKLGDFEDNRRFDDDSGQDSSEEENIDELAAAGKEDVSKDVTDFAYHDRMESDDEDHDYERNLGKFKGNRRLLELVKYLHDGEGDGRRSENGADPEQEVLLHHAFPVDMTVRGFIQVPLND